MDKIEKFNNASAFGTTATDAEAHDAEMRTSKRRRRRRGEHSAIDHDRIASGDGQAPNAAYAASSQYVSYSGADDATAVDPALAAIGSGDAENTATQDSQTAHHRRRRQKHSTSAAQQQQGMPNMMLDPLTAQYGSADSAAMSLALAAVASSEQVLSREEAEGTASASSTAAARTEFDGDMARRHMDGAEHTVGEAMDGAGKDQLQAVAAVSNGGSFSPEETYALEDFMTQYQQENGLDRIGLCRRVWSNERKKDNFWDSVANALPHRTRASVYKHVRRKYNPYVLRGRWTSREDEELRQLFEIHGAQWKVIGRAIDRMPEDCRDRYRNYVKCGESRGQNKWNPEEEEKLATIVQQIKFADPNADINWTVVSERMGGIRSRIQCRYKWKKLNRHLEPPLEFPSMT
ncbi:uncharacterized protein V1518DRAFT_418781 [Limtongia smithiae]|uniref:uncharacterized protein n=1 Tax=Limtongia smithiae TaxID=1125753 RepID=UPI0034CE2EF7